MPILNLTLQPGRLSVCQLPADSALPAWAASAAFVAVTRTAEELSLVVPEALAPAEIKQEAGWRCLKVHGPLGFGLTGILASILEPLAKARISVFAVSTFNTDYVLIKETNAEAAVAALRTSGHTVTVA